MDIEDVESNDPLTLLLRHKYTDEQLMEEVRRRGLDVSGDIPHCIVRSEYPGEYECHARWPDGAVTHGIGHTREEARSAAKRQRARTQAYASVKMTPPARVEIGELFGMKVYYRDDLPPCVAVVLPSGEGFTHGDSERINALVKEHMEKNNADEG